MSLTLIGASLSPYVRKTLVFLAEKNIACEREPLIPFNVPPEYKRISPLGKIPCLKDGERALADSSAICAYLERKQPEPRLYPEDAFDYGRAIWFEEYADTALGQAGLPIFQERVIQQRFFQKQPDQARIEKAEQEDLPPVLDYLEEQLGDSDFLVGGRFGIADIAVASPFVNFAYGGWSLDAGRWPHLAGFLERVQGRPSFKAALQEDAGMLGGS